MTRHSYTMVLEITPSAALTHGQGTNGNEQELHRRTFNVYDEARGKWVREDIPCVSGAALKSTLREHAGMLFLELAGISELSRDGLRLLFKGGRLTGSSASAKLEEARRLRDLLPPLSVFGAMDGAMVMRGRASVSCVMPYTETVVRHGFIDTAGIETASLHSGAPALPDHMVESPRPVTYYRHDMKTAPYAALLPAAERKAIEDAAAARKGKAATKTERREANESMPHAFQAIAPGTPMVATVRLTDATETEAACMMLAVTRWISSGGHLGGAKSKGHGACRVRVARVVRTRAGEGPVPVATADAEALVAVEEVDHSAGAIAERYAAHVREHATDIAAELGQ